MDILIAAVAGYGLGSIPFGLALVRLAGLGDIRRIGSGNIGATNVLRTGNKPLALATLVLDGGKGAAAVLILTFALGAEAGWVAGGAAMVGHCFPVWLGFKGGKGVATGLGTLLAAAWPVGLAACATWLVMAGLKRISSLAALTALGLSPMAAAALAGQGFVRFEVVALCAAIAAVVFYRHADNIRRLIDGTEPKIGAKQNDGSTDAVPGG